MTRKEVCLKLIEHDGSCIGIPCSECINSPITNMVLCGQPLMLERAKEELRKIRLNELRKIKR